jgi:hypothetical protein
MIPIDVLRAAAVEYLRYEVGCKLVCLERTPIRNDPCNPDVVGLNATRRMIEIEIKRTWADFKGNREKWSMKRRAARGIAPSQFYFLVPPDLVEKVLPELEEGEGLLTLEGCGGYSGLPKVAVRKKARPSGARPLRIKEVIRMVQHQTGTLSSALTKIAKASSSKIEVDAAP